MCATWTNDSLTRHYAPNGIHSVKVGYHFIQNINDMGTTLSSQNILISYWAARWSLDIPPEMKLFV